MQSVPIIDSNQIQAYTNYPDLIAEIKIGFSSSDTVVPLRHHHQYSNPEELIDSTLLIMPAWNPGKELGVKIVTVSPNNGKYNLPSIQGAYLLFNAHDGTVKAILDAKALTAKRTAAASALAATYLAVEDASVMLMIGTGVLARELILAHSSVRDLKKVYVWGRNYAKAEELCREFSEKGFEILPVKEIKTVIAEADIISAATLSQSPLILGKYLRNGQHIDLVGSYKKDMREADDETILRSQVFLDSYSAGLKESGDIVIPIEKGILRERDIRADMEELCSGTQEGRRNSDEITLFKSVGHAVEDLVAAKYYYNRILKNKP
ncbi:MAG: ornithine cyclodeaminase family protein [Flavobacteriia bacterium]|nr:MAG: ornithine cyclodeaminase family protein [Flavobacteriia bacterium]